MTHEPHALLAAPSGRAMSLERVDVRGRVAGLLQSMTARQAYRNATDETLEVVYTFPLPWGAVLLGLSVELAGRRLDGAVLARPEAEARYEEAVADGDSPIRVRKGPDGLFTVDLGNLKPGEAATVELRWAQPLRVEQGRVRLAVPTTIAPRYGDMAAQPGMRPHDSTAASLSADYGFSLSLDLDAHAAGGTIESPSHAISVTPLADGGARVAIAGEARLDRDFVLSLATTVQPSGTARALRAADGEGCVVMASFSPALDASPPGPLDLKLLVDCSGSMGGDSIASARRGLERVLSALRPADRVSFSRFGSSVRHVLDALHPADGPTLQRLQREVAATDATMGGTELNDALVSTFSLRGMRAGAKADVLLVTDGQVADVEPVVAAARASGHRVFAVGVGTAPAESLLRTLAESTGGACELVAPGESVEAAIERTFARLRVPRVSGVLVDWGAAPSWATEAPLQLFDGDTLHVFAGFRAVDAARVAPRLLFTVATRTGRGRARVESTQGWALSATVEDAAAASGAVRDASIASPATAIASSDGDPADASPAEVLPRLAAAHRIGALDRRRTARRRAGVPASARDEIRELALRYRLVTDETDLFLVHVRAEADKADGLPTLQQTEQMLAAGWGGTGSVRPRQTDVTHSLRAAHLDASMSDIAPRFESLRSASAMPRRSPRFSIAEGEDLRSILERAIDGGSSMPSASERRAVLTPRRLLALVRRHLGDNEDVEALVSAVRGAPLPAAPLAMLTALQDVYGLSEGTAWLALLGALDDVLGAADLPGDAARDRLRRWLLRHVPDSARNGVRAEAGRHLASVTLEDW